MVEGVVAVHRPGIHGGERAGGKVGIAEHHAVGWAAMGGPTQLTSQNSCELPQAVKN